MLSEFFIILWILPVTLLGFSFFRLYRRRQDPSRLNMRAGNSSAPPGLEGLSTSDERTLDCWFNYNGHLWEAHEVLGLPAGSSREDIEAAYKAQCSEMDPSSRSLVDHALKVLIKKGA